MVTYLEKTPSPSWYNYLKRYLGENIFEAIDDYLDTHYHYTDFYKHIYIAGGAVRNYFLGEPPSDIDMFFDSNKTREEIIQILETSLKLERVFETTVPGDEGWSTITYLTSNKIPLQIIATPWLWDGFSPMPQHIRLLNLFDYTICMACYVMPYDKIILHPDFFEHLACKNLVYTGSDFPLSSLRRAFKFQHKGFYLCDEMLLRIVEDITRKINFDNSEDLARHVAGMDPNGERRIRPID